MSSESQNDQKPAMGSHHPAPPRTDPLPCPRCASTSTKFCYYNNYNLSQPRYFCKGCRRYWTQGGTLRNVPVGGGTRKSSNSKRHRSCPSSSTNTNTTTSSSSSSSTVTHEPGPESEPEPILLPIPANPVSVLPVKGEMGSNVMMNLNESLALPMNLNESYPVVSGNFATLLDIQGGGGYGLDEMGLGFGPTRIWPFLDTTGYLGVGGVNGNNNNGGGGGGSSTVGCNNNNNNTWQMGDVENVDGDCYGWPGLAISTSGKGLK